MTKEELKKTLDNQPVNVLSNIVLLLLSPFIIVFGIICWGLLFF